MTREEAIKVLSDIDKAWRNFSKEEYVALDMAIKAFKQESFENCISRQAVLDYIYNDLGLGDEENGKDVERQMELESSYRYIKSLPFVTPQQKIGRWIALGNHFYKCSECRCCEISKSNWCPNCGARMQEVEE